MQTFDQIRHFVERQVYPDGNIGIRDIGLLALDPLQVVCHLFLAVEQCHVAATLERVFGEIYAVIGHLRQLIQCQFLLVQRLLLSVTNLVQFRDQLFPPHVYGVGESETLILDGTVRCESCFHLLHHQLRDFFNERLFLLRNERLSIRDELHRTLQQEFLITAI